MATFTDNTSSNGMKDVWVAKVDYSTTAYEGYTLVQASLLLTIKYGWEFTLNNGYSLSINGDKVSGSTYKVKQTDSGGKGVTHTLLTHSVKVYHTANQTITISASINANNIWYKSGGYYVGTYSLSKNDITLSPLKTACIAPTAFTVSSNNFETNVTLTWSGAGGGVGNAIASYLIRYCTSSNNSTWGSWTDLTTVTSTSSSGTKTIDMSSKVSRGYYVKFAIRTQPSDTNYVSAWQYSSAIRRQAYTKCAAPTVFTVASDNFDTEITLNWSGASGGTSNGVSAYEIQYAVSSNGSSWGNWTTFRTITTTNTSHSLAVNVESYVDRGYYVKFQIQTQGTAGSSYYSDWKSSNAIRRNPKSICLPPTQITLQAPSKLENTMTANSSYVFEDGIKVSWNVGTAGDGVAISGYILQRQTAYLNDSDEMVWDEWTTYTITTSAVRASNVDASSLDRGNFIRFRVATQANDTKYNSAYITSSIMKRNTLPQNLPNGYVQYPNEFADGEQITLKWNAATDIDSESPYIANVEGYDIWGRVEATEGETVVKSATYNFKKHGARLDYYSASYGLLYSLVSNKNNPIKDGESYTVIWDGVKYNNIIAKQTSTQILLGNASITSNAEVDTNEPFLIVISGLTYDTMLTTCTIYTLSTDPTHSIAIKKYVADNTNTWTRIASIRNISNSRDITMSFGSTATDISIDNGAFYNVNGVTSQNTLMTFYNGVANEQYIKLKIVPVDMFCGSTQIETLKSEALILAIQRYDRSGIALGINSAWVDCQIYYCTNGVWSEVDVCAGVNNSWKQCNE